jgi:hypothetical protein
MSDLKNDIERYLKGELTPSEMHALEKKALSDPFLADALEGASELNAYSFDSDVQDLKMLIDNRTDQSKKVIPLWSWTLRIAAGLILVAVSTFVILNLVQDNKPVQLAENKTEPASPVMKEKEQVPLLDSIEQPQTTLSLSESKPATTQPAPSSFRISEKPKAEVQPSVAASPNLNSLAEAEIPATVSKEQNARGAEAEEGQIAKAKPAEAPILSSKKIELKEDVSKDSKKKEADAASGFTDLYSADKSIASNKRTIKGHVSSLEDGSALPGVNVIVKGTEVGTVTDAEGNYEITLTDTQDELVFSFVGLQSTEMDASILNQLDVQLSEDYSALSEVVVTGYATRSDDDTEDEAASLELASPVGGRKAYKQYLEKSLRYPEVALENKIEGKVTIEFTVQTTGALSEFKVVRGLGYGCDN